MGDALCHTTAVRPHFLFPSHPLSARSHLFRGLVLEVQPPGMSLKKEGGSP